MKARMCMVTLLIVGGAAQFGVASTMTMEVYPEEGTGGGMDVYQQTLHFPKYNPVGPDMGELVKAWITQNVSASAVFTVTNDSGSTATITAGASGWFDYECPGVYAIGDFPNRHFVFGQGAAVDVLPGAERSIDLGTVDLGPFTDSVYGSFLMPYRGSGTVAFNFTFHVGTQVDPSVPTSLKFSTSVVPVLHYEYRVPEPSLFAMACVVALLRSFRRDDRSTL